MLDLYVLLTFKGIQQRGALPAQERGSQKLPGVLDPYVLLTLQETQQRGALPVQETSSHKLSGLLDPYVLLTFNSKEFSREEPCQARRERLPEAAAGAGSFRPPYF